MKIIAVQIKVFGILWGNRFGIHVVPVWPCYCFNLLARTYLYFLPRKFGLMLENSKEARIVESGIRSLEPFSVQSLMFRV